VIAALPEYGERIMQVQSSAAGGENEPPSLKK